MGSSGVEDRQRALAVIAHPDDAEFWAGGTIAAWTAAGVEVSYLVLTDGEAGGFDPRVPRVEIPRIRRAEQQKAAAVLGVSDVRVLGRDEGGVLATSPELHVELVRAIRRVRPQRIITWSPEWNWQRFRSCHPDHLATGTLTLHAVYPDAGNPFALTALRDDLAAYLRGRIAANTAAAGLSEGRLAEVFQVVVNR